MGYYKGTIRVSGFQGFRVLGFRVLGVVPGLKVLGVGFICFRV